MRYLPTIVGGAMIGSILAGLVAPLLVVGPIPVDVKESVQVIGAVVGAFFGLYVAYCNRS